jgi:hypothetical protein
MELVKLCKRLEGRLFQLMERGKLGMPSENIVMGF